LIINPDQDQIFTLAQAELTASAMIASVPDSTFEEI
jgi:hypothetical protein